MVNPLVFIAGGWLLNKVTGNPIGKITGEKLDEVGEKTKETISEAIQDATALSIDAVMIAYDGMKNEIQKRIKGNESDIVMYLMITIGSLSTILFLWRTIGRPR